MSFQKILLEEKVKIEERIQRFFDSCLQPGAFSHQFVQQYYTDLKKYILFGGKRLRPVSVVMIYKGLGGVQDTIYDLAICVELLHNASLVHDDIIDHDLVRRGQPSFHAFYQSWFNKNLKKDSKEIDFGMAMGILGGDLLIDLGQEAIFRADFNSNKKLKAVMYYQQAFKELIDGVVAESYLQNIPIDKVTENDYLSMINGKTSALFEKSILIGAVLADETEKNKKNLSEFALLLGQAFQIRDDILGVFGDSAKTGKSTEGDIREGKKTLLAIYGSSNTELKSLYGKADITNQEVIRVRELLKETGALERTKSRALELAKRASAVLKEIKLEAQSFLFFNDLIKFVQDRIL